MNDRRHVQRRTRQDRRTAGSALDVTRLEHENLFSQVEEILRAIRRIEGDIARLAQRLDRAELTRNLATADPHASA